MSLLLGAIVCLSVLSSCGRLGFSTDAIRDVTVNPGVDDDDDVPSAESPLPDGDDAPGADDEGNDPPEGPSPSDDAGGLDPGSMPDASSEDPQHDGGATPPSDAGSDPPVGTDAGPDIEDAGMSEPDAGRRGPGALDCDALNKSTTLVCTSFEPGLPARSSTRTGNGAIQIEQGHLAAETSRGEGFAALDVSFDAQSSGSLYLAAWFQVPDGFALSAANIVGLQATSGNDPSVDVNLVTDGALEIFASQAKLTKVAPDFAVPRAEWLCLKARILLSSSTGEIDLSVDGASLFALRKLNTLPAVGVDQLSVGFDWTGNTQAPARIVFDNLILSTREISGDCP